MVSTCWATLRGACLTTSSGGYNFPRCLFLADPSKPCNRADGYDTRFGVTYVDYQTQQRYAKDSARMLSKVSLACNAAEAVADLVISGLTGILRNDG